MKFRITTSPNTEAFAVTSQRRHYAPRKQVACPNTDKHTSNAATLMEAHEQRPRKSSNNKN